MGIDYGRVQEHRCRINLNVAHGTTSWPETCRPAEEFYRFMKHSKNKRELAEKSAKLVSETRELVGRMLHCHSRNIFFSSSVTAALIPIALTLSYGRKKMSAVVSDHEYLAIYKLLKEGFFDARLTTWQNFGVGTLDNTKLSIPRTEVQVTKMADKPALIVEQMNVPDDRPAIFVLSHVSRVDARVVDIKAVYGELQKLNEKRGKHNKIYFVVDGSQAIGTFDFSVVGACDAYLGTSSKGIGAEPTLGIAYVNDGLLNLMKAHIRDTGYPSILFQFSLEVMPNQLNAKKNASLSLPEIASLNFSLKKLLGMGMSEVERRLDRLGKIIGKALESTDKIKVLNPDSPRSPYMIFLKVNSDVEETVEKFSRSGIEIFHNQDYSMVDHPPAIRVSWNINTPEEHITKFLDTLFHISCIRETQKAKY
jgi:selenocysteine lyase/cysteine desulfurase